MTLIRRTNPFGELISLRQAMDRLLEDSWVSALADEHSFALDLRSTPDAFEIDAALPGIEAQDVDISILGETLTITAATHDEKSSDEEGYSHREIRRGSFSRMVTLPGGVGADAATATFENGMLHLSIPKAEEAKARQIQIKATGAPAEPAKAEVIEGARGE